MSFLVKQLMKSAVGQAATGRDVPAHANGGAPMAGRQGAVASGGAPVGPSHAAVVRTLMIRIETCQVAQDRREALDELASVPDLGSYLTSDQAAALLHVAKQFVGVDPQVPVSILSILTTATDPATTTVGQSEAILLQIVDVPFLLGFLDDASFWAKYHAVQLLQRIEETSTSTVHQQLLASHGLHAIIDVLNDGANGGALRNEGLVLLSALTATNQELQTIIAFENGFDSLFQIIREEAGLAGGIVVTDCLSTVMNMLRGNNATQKFFREMGCTRHLVPLLSAVAPSPAQLQSLGKGRQAEGPAPEAWVQAYNDPITPDASLTLQRCFSILQCLLRGSDLNGDGAVTRQTLVQCGIVPALATVAFAPSERVDASNRVEALRTIGMLLNKARASCDALAQCRTPQRWDTGKDGRWFMGSAVWATLRLMVSTNDAALQSVCSGILASLVDASSSSVTMASMLMKNLSKPASAAVAVPTTDVGHCGQLVACSLFDCLTGASPFAPYYTAVLLQQVLMVPQATEQLLHVAWEGQGKPFFVAYVQHTVRVIQSKKADVCTVAALLRPIIVWLMFTARAVMMLLNDPSLFTSLLEWSLQIRHDGVHTRFLCMIAAAAIAVAAPANPRDGALMTSRSMQHLGDAAVLDKPSMVAQLQERTDRGRRLRDLIADVESSVDWTDAPVSATSSPPCIYDTSFKTLIADIAAQTLKLLDVEATTATTHPTSSPAQQHGSVGAPSPRSASPTLAQPPPPPPIKKDVAAALTEDRHRITQSPQEVDRQFPPSPPPYASSMAIPAAASTPSPAVPVPEGLAPLSHSHAVDETVFNDMRAELQELRAALAAKDATLRQEQDKAQALISALTQEKAAVEAKLHDATASKSVLESQHADTTALLEEALLGKEEEARALAASLSMLESRLHNSMQEANGAQELKHQLDTAQLERDELLILVAELDEEREVRSAAEDASMISPPRTATDVDVSPGRGHSDGE